MDTVTRDGFSCDGSPKRVAAGSYGEEKMMKSVASLLSFVLSFSAFAAPLALRPEVPVSAPVYSLGSEVSRGDAHLATNGDEYLAVWADYREGGEASLYAARMRADGTFIDPFGLRVAQGAHAGAVVWTGSKYLIVYETGPESHSFVRTMTPDAVFGEPIEVGRGGRYGAMATNGTNVLLVLPEKALLLDLEGNPVKNVALTLGEHYSDVHVAAAGSSYLVAAALPSVVVQSVSSDGVVGTLQTLAPLQGYTQIGLASDSERFLVAWSDKRVYGQLVTSEGAPAGPVHKIALTGNAKHPAVAWRDGEYLLVFYGGQYEALHYGVRVAADGSAIGEPKRVDGLERSEEVAIAAHGRGGIVLFHGHRAGVFDDASVAGGDLFRRMVDVAVTARAQTSVRLARLDDGYVAAWIENNQVFLSTEAGTTPVTVAGSTYSLIDVVVDRSNIIWVFWSQEGHWFATSRFWGNLEPIDPGPIYFQTPGIVSITPVAAGEGVIALAYELGDDDQVHDVAALLLWETGTGIARKEVVLTTELGGDFRPAVAFDGTAFVYGWAHAKGPYLQDQPDPVIEFVGARVTPDGELLDATPVRIADDIGYVTRTDAALGANGVAFAWQADERTTRLALFDGTQLELGGPQNVLGELAPHDGGFLLVRGIPRQPPLLTETEYVVLDADLVIRASGELPPFVAADYHTGHGVDVIGGDDPVFAYTKLANGSYGNVARVFVRRTGEPLPRRRAIGH
jgi:hypothetical protein